MRLHLRPFSRRTPLLLNIAPVVLAMLLAGALAIVPGPTRAELAGEAASAAGNVVPTRETTVAQRQQSGARPDPAVKDLAAQKAKDYVLASADGERQCPLTLKADPAAQGFLLQFDRPICEAALPFLSQVAGWVPDESGALHFLNAQGRTVAEFTEATGGSYEALREGDGVYFLSDPGMKEGTEVTEAEVSGDWDLAAGAAGGAAKPLCRWTLTDVPAPKGGKAVKVAPGCDAALERLAPVAWQLEGGNILITPRSGAPIRFARQEDGGWARVPERGRPLLMSRP